MIWKSGPEGRVAKSLLTLWDQVNTLAPNRSQSDDGTIGDVRHQATASDHNPDEHGVVTALDITHDPEHGMDTYALAEALRQNKDKRIKYVISNHRIWNSIVSPYVWRSYSGANPHDMHVHISVHDDPALYDLTDPFKFTLPAVDPDAPKVRPLLTRGSHGPDVEVIQRLLNIDVDGLYGPATAAAVKAFQAAHNLAADGILGPYTWRELLTPTAPPLPPPVPTPDWSSGRGSWYSQFRGKYVWEDRGDKPGSAALGVLDKEQGVSFYNRNTLGKWFEVKAPNGTVSIEQQTDIGPHPTTGRLIDISSAAAERFGYSPTDFPTDSTWRWHQIDAPAAVKGLSPQQQAAKFLSLRK